MAKLELSQQTTLSRKYYNNSTNKCTIGQQWPGSYCVTSIDSSEENHNYTNIAWAFACRL